MKILLTSAMALGVVVLFEANQPTQASAESQQGQVILAGHGHHGYHHGYGYNNYGWGGGYYGGPVYGGPVYVDPYYGDPYYNSGAEIQLGPVGIDLF